VSDKAKSLVRQMLEADPKRRLSAQQVLGIYHDCFRLLFVTVFCLVGFVTMYSLLHYNKWVQDLWLGMESDLRVIIGSPDFNGPPLTFL
jgi:hypothetical protein